MNRKQKQWLIIGPVVVSFVFAMTSPVVQVYFMRLVSPNILAIANMLSVGLAAGVNTTVGIDKFMESYRKNFKWIVSIDVICFGIISFMGVEWAAVRFLGFAVLNAVSTTLWMVIIRSAINRKIDGDKLTAWQSYSEAWNLYASLAGGAILLVYSDVSIETAVAMQCIANLFMGITDIKAFSKLEEQANE